VRERNGEIIRIFRRHAFIGYYTAAAGRGKAIILQHIYIYVYIYTCTYTLSAYIYVIWRCAGSRGKAAAAENMSSWFFCPGEKRE